MLPDTTSARARIAQCGAAILPGCTRRPAGLARSRAGADMPQWRPLFVLPAPAPRPPSAFPPCCHWLSTFRPLPGPHAVQIRDDELELRSILPLHLKALERAHFAQGVEQFALLLIGYLTLDECNHDNPFARTDRHHLMQGRGRVKYRGARSALDADRFRAQVNEQLAAL